MSCIPISRLYASGETGCNVNYTTRVVPAEYCTWYTLFSISTASLGLHAASDSDSVAYRRELMERAYLMQRLMVWYRSMCYLYTKCTKFQSFSHVNTEMTPMSGWQPPPKLSSFSLNPSLTPDELHSYFTTIRARRNMVQFEFPYLRNIVFYTDCVRSARLL